MSGSDPHMSLIELNLIGHLHRIVVLLLILISYFLGWYLLIFSNC
jgi:hypothetical protein